MRKKRHLVGVVLVKSSYLRAYKMSSAKKILFIQLITAMRKKRHLVGVVLVKSSYLRAYKMSSAKNIIYTKLSFTLNLQLNPTIPSSLPCSTRSTDALVPC